MYRGFGLFPMGYTCKQVLASLFFSFLLSAGAQFSSHSTHMSERSLALFNGVMFFHIYGDNLVSQQ